LTSGCAWCVARGRWLLGRLGFGVVSAALAAGALILLFTWWRAPSIQLDGRLDPGNYDATGSSLLTRGPCAAAP
jgi:hypothetical protein